MKFIEKAPIFLDAVLAIEIMQVPQSNLEEKVTPSILKDNFSSKNRPIHTPSIEINKPLPAPAQCPVDQTQIQKPI